MRQELGALVVPAGDPVPSPPVGKAFLFPVTAAETSWGWVLQATQGE